MSIKHIDFYYFSGTGNTLLVVQELARIFQKNGVDVALHKIEKTRPEDIVPNDTLGLAFPVAVQGTYEFIWDFIRRLPKVPRNKTVNAFMVDTLAVFSGGIVGPVKKILDQKGYNTIAAKEFIMPSNMFFKTKKKDKISKSLEKTRRFAIDLIEGKTTWKRFPILSDLMSIFSRSAFLWRKIRKFYTLSVDKKKCTKCGLCAKLCPVENIVMSPFPVHSDKCACCLRCVAFCPSNAISIKGNKKYKQYRAVEAKDLL